MNRKASFAALLGVVAVSIVFGMIVGGRLNAPPVMHAARETAAGIFPAASGPSGAGIAGPDFASIAESTIPAVVGVQNTAVNKNAGDDQGDDDQGNDQPFDDPMFRFFHRGPRQPQSQRHVSSGSGFIITDDGYILTNNHVVEGATKLQVTLDTGEKFEAKVIGTDPMIDLGLIKIDPKGKKLPTLPLGDSDSLKIGNWVMAIGNPLGLERTVTVGVVSGKKRQVPIGTTVPGLANFIQTDAAINFGNSGGPLLDAQGRVVGISTAIFRGELAEGIGFAIPINEARHAAEEIRSGGSVKRGYLGVTMGQSGGISDRMKDYYKLPDTNGVRIARVTPAGPADRAGLQKDDIVRKIDGDVVKDNQDLQSRVAAHKPGETVKLDVVRAGETKRIDVKLGTRPVTFDEEGNESKPKSNDDEGESAESMQGLGIKVQAIPPFLRQRLELAPGDPGVMIVSVDPESDAAEEGLQPQAIVLSVNDVPVKSVAEWNKMVRDLKPGTTAKIEVRVGKAASDVVFVTVPQKSK
jgi:serine protease Do